jgi:hypothetical protein
MEPGDLDRLIKICGMLGSNQDGERANAGKAATNLLNRLGLTWGEVLGKPATATAGKPRKPRAKKPKPPPSPPPSPPPPPPPPPEPTPKPQANGWDWVPRAQEIRESHFQFANDWEQKFILDLLQQNRPHLSARQTEKLNEIWTQCRERPLNPSVNPFVNPFAHGKGVSGAQ